MGEGDLAIVPIHGVGTFCHNWIVRSNGNYPVSFLGNMVGDCRDKSCSLLHTLNDLSDKNRYRSLLLTSEQPDQVAVLTRNGAIFVVQSHGSSTPEIQCFFFPGSIGPRGTNPARIGHFDNASVAG
jgi:hypothetical protein